MILFNTLNKFIDSESLLLKEIFCYKDLIYTISV